MEHVSGLETESTISNGTLLTRRRVYQPMPRSGGVGCSLVLPGFQFQVKDRYR